MPTVFTPPPTEPTTWPQYPVKQVRLKLADFFVERTPREWRDARELFSPANDYHTAESLIEDGSLAAVNALAKDFYIEIRKLHKALKKAAQDWLQVLGEVAEIAIRALVERKYGPAGTSHIRDELCADLYDSALPPSKGVMPLASMGKKPMDVICWNDVTDVGEMHEVKRVIVSFKDAEKLRRMRQFKSVAEGKAGRAIWLGVAGFYDPVGEVQASLRTLLMLWDEADPLNLDILVPETYATWLGQSYL